MCNEAITGLADQGTRRIRLEPTARAARDARRFVSAALADLGHADLIEDARLIASELVTNARAPRGALSYPRHSREELKGGSWV
jgi:hypothetical protein